MAGSTAPAHRASPAQGHATRLVVFSLVTQVIVVAMSTLITTRYQARLHDTNANRTALARAMYGNEIDHSGLTGPALASAVRLLSTCSLEYGVEPIPAHVRRGWPREKIYRPSKDRIFVNVLAAETEAGTNVFFSASEVMVSNVVPSRFFQHGSDKYFGILYSSNSSKLRRPNEASPLLGSEYLPSKDSAFTIGGLANPFTIDNAPETTPVIGGADAHNTAAWDSAVFDMAIKNDGRDIMYDQVWQSMQVATARLTRREQ